MIEILKHGKKDSKFQLTCPFCACEFRYEELDVEGDFFIRCPDCGAMIDHNFYQGKSISEQFCKRVDLINSNV